MHLLQCFHCESEFDVSDLPEKKQYRCSICTQIIEIPPFPKNPVFSEKNVRSQKPRKKTLLEESLLEKPPVSPVKKSLPTKKKKANLAQEINATIAAKTPLIQEDSPKLNLKKEIASKRKKTERLAKSEIRREISTQLIQKERSRPSPSLKKPPKKSPKKWLKHTVVTLVMIMVTSVIIALYFSPKKNTPPSSTHANLKKNELREQFEATFEVHLDTVEKLFALAAWCKEKNLEDEQKRCYTRILEIDPQHEGALIALGKKLPEAIGIFDPLFGKGLFQEIEKNSIKVASDHLSVQELETIANSGAHFLNLFLKENESALNDKGYHAQNIPSFHIAVFSKVEAYQAYCKTLQQERAANEAGFLDTSKHLLISYPKIETHYGEVPEKVTLQGNPGELLNTAIFQACYLEKESQKLVIPKLNLVARKHLGDNYYSILKNHFFVAMQNSDSYVSKFAIQSFVDLLDLSYNWIFSRYQEAWGLKESDHLMGLYIFRSKKEFTEHAELDESHGILGFYRPWTHQMFTFRAIGDTEIENTVIHEGTHMIMHYFTGYRPPDQSKELFWFQEGIAEFFGSWARDKENGEIILEQLNQMRFRGLWSQAVSKSEDPKRSLLPLKRILSMSVIRAEVESQTEKELKDKLYKQGWGLVHFFMYHDNGKYREKFHHYVKMYVQGTSGWPAFVKIFEIKSQKKLEEMEEEFREYIKSLKRKD